MVLKKMKKLLLLVLLGAGIYGYLATSPQEIQSTKSTVGSAFGTEYSSADTALEKAYENKRSDLQIGGSGRVIKILPDDVKGSRHQRFILQLATGQTLLIAHNIDIAPRINNLRIGDQIDFYGEYEWNPKGGVIHWTHQDPQGRHEAGWLMHDGKVYK